MYVTIHVRPLNYYKRSYLTTQRRWKHSSKTTNKMKTILDYATIFVLIMANILIIFLFAITTEVGYIYLLPFGVYTLYLVLTHQNID